MSDTDTTENYPPTSVARFMVSMLGAGLDNLLPHRRDQLNRLAIRLSNKSPSALQAAWAFDRGEISGEQLLDLMGTGSPLQEFLPEAGDRSSAAVLKFPAPAGYRHIPESVIAFANGLADRFAALPDAEQPGDQISRLHRLLVSLRDGVTATWDACDRYDRGEITGEELLMLMR